MLPQAGAQSAREHKRRNWPDRNNQHDEVVGSGTPVMLLVRMNPRAVDREGVPSAPKSCRRPRRPGDAEAILRSPEPRHERVQSIDGKGTVTLFAPFQQERGWGHRSASSEGNRGGKPGYHRRLEQGGRRHHVHGQTSDHNGTTPVNKPKLLIVDDDEAIRTQLKYALRDDFTLLFAEDRGSALTTLRAEHPELVSLDLGLPPHPDAAEEGLKALDEIMKAA